MKYEDVFEMVGRTPHVRVPGPEGLPVRVHVKLEGANPTGSVKDRAGLRMVREALDAGTLRPGMTFLDASSGNMACALAYIGRILGYPTELVVSSKLTEDKRNFLRFYGATLHQVGSFTIEGNHFCRERAESDGGERYCFFDQLHNWANPRAHYEGTGPEILEAFPDVEMVVASLGSGGTLCGTAQFFREKRPDVRIVAVQSASGTRLPGTGSFDDGDYVTPFIRRGLDEGMFDHVVKISEADAVRRALELRDRGVFVGLQTGGVYHATLEAVRELGVRGDVVFVSGDSGWKNVDKLLPHAPASTARSG